MNSSKNRRSVSLGDLNSAVGAVELLASDGYEMRGNWTLAQICQHLRLTQDASIDGYPKWMSLFMPLRPLIRTAFLSRLLDGRSTAGIPTSSIYVPGNDLEEAAEVTAFKHSVTRFHEHEGLFHPHPGFGISDRTQLERLHAAHAAHHLGFLIPRSNAPDDSESRSS